MATSVLKSKHSVTSLLGIINQFHSLAGILPDLRYDCTLNSKYQILPNVASEDLKNGVKAPLLRYFGIGVNGKYNVNDTNLSAAYNPSGEEMDLYSPIPFRVVPRNADLTAAERAQYRLRQLVTVNGTEYWCYWLKLIDFSGSNIAVSKVNTTTGEETPYELDPDNQLSPVPTKYETPDVVDSRDYYVKVAVDAVCKVTGAEIAEWIDVFKGGDTRYANISEFGFYTGEDIQHEEITNGVAVKYTEAAYVQLAHKRCSNGADLSDVTASITETVSFEHHDNIML